MKNNIGIMQGRLTPPHKNFIQSFPWNNWKEEIIIAKKNNFNNLEWTIDDYKFQENPIILKPRFVRKFILCSAISNRPYTYLLSTF